MDHKQALCLTEAPNTTWRHAHIYYMEQVAKWERKLREISRLRIEKHLDDKKGNVNG